MSNPDHNATMRSETTVSEGPREAIATPSTYFFQTSAVSLSLAMQGRALSGEQSSYNLACLADQA